MIVTIDSIRIEVSVTRWWSSIIVLGFIRVLKKTIKCACVDYLFEACPGKSNLLARPPWPPCSLPTLESMSWEHEADWPTECDDRPLRREHTPWPNMFGCCELVSLSVFKIYLRVSSPPLHFTIKPFPRSSLSLPHFVKHTARVFSLRHSTVTSLMGVNYIPQGGQRGEGRRTPLPPATSKLSSNLDKLLNICLGALWHAKVFNRSEEIVVRQTAARMKQRNTKSTLLDIKLVPSPIPSYHILISFHRMLNKTKSTT